MYACMLLLLTISVSNQGAMFAKQPHGANQTVRIVSSFLCEVDNLGSSNWPQTLTGQ